MPPYLPLNPGEPEGFLRLFQVDYWLLGQYPSEEDIAAVQQGEGRAPRGAARVVSDVKLQPLPGFVEMTAANRMAAPVPPMATAPGN